MHPQGISTLWDFKEGGKNMENKGLKITIGLLIVLLVASVFASFNNNGGTDNPADAQRSPVSEDDDAIKGDINAPVTIIEFSDYECPFCARFYEQTLPELKEKYIDTGKVKFVYRDFPLSGHRNAQKAAEAAECAGDQGKYYGMHDMLFEQGVSGGVDSYKQYASNLELNTEEFNNCLDSGKHYGEVQNDLRDGSAAGVGGTPAFFINGIFLSGAQPFSAFEQIIESELS